jgi:Sulfocyanin (SoxE) domain
MIARFARLALVAAALGLLPGIASAGEPFIPSWIKNDPAARTVAVEIVADWNQVARYAKDNIRTDIIDFNGYWGGNLTIVVPTGWSVRIAFINGSQSFRHSLMVTRVYAQAEMPVKLRPEDAVWGAYTDPPEGIYTNERRQLDFVARQAGSYFLACARQTHLMDGHWIGFEVRDGLEQAVAIVHDDKFPPEQPPGRP